MIQQVRYQLKDEMIIYNLQKSLEFINIILKKNLRYNYVHVYVCRLISDRNMSVLLKMKVLILEKLHTKYVYNIIVLRVCIIIIKLTLWGRTPLRREVFDTTLSVKSLSVTCCRLVISSTNKTDHHDPWYNWNIVESGIKHHSCNSNPMIIKGCLL